MKAEPEVIKGDSQAPAPSLCALLSSALCSQLLPIRIQEAGWRPYFSNQLQRGALQRQTKALRILSPFIQQQRGKWV